VLIETDEGLANLLRTVRHIALVGASHKPQRPSYQVLEFLLKKGYRVTPVNPGLAGQCLQGQAVVGALRDIDDPVDLVDIFRDGSALPDLVDEAIAIGAPSLWTQLDVRHPAAEQKALDHGLTVVIDKCPAIEWPRLEARGLL
jgi:predicted CoA-binding protein